MGQSLSMDLRTRLLAAIDAGMSCRSSIVVSRASRAPERRPGRPSGQVARNPAGGMRSDENGSPLSNDPQLGSIIGESK
jgi:hypothetical protein